MQEARLRGAWVMLTQAYQEPHEVSEWAWYPFVAENMRLDERSREFLAGVLASERAANPGLRIESRLLHGPAVPLVTAAGYKDTYRTPSRFEHRRAHRLARAPRCLAGYPSQPREALKRSTRGIVDFSHSRFTRACPETP